MELQTYPASIFSTKAAPKQAVEEESDDDLFGGGGCSFV